MKTLIYLVILFIAGFLFIPNRAKHNKNEIKVAPNMHIDIEKNEPVEKELIQKEIETGNEINRTIDNIEKNYKYISYKQKVLKIAQPFFNRYGNHYVIVKDDNTKVYEGYLKNFKKTKLYTIGGLFTFEIYSEALLGEQRIQRKNHILTKTIKL